MASLKCPITCKLFVDPVTLIKDGTTYENAAIRHWIRTKHTSPMTRASVNHTSDYLMHDRRAREPVELCVAEGWAEPSEIEEWKKDRRKQEARFEFYRQWWRDQEKHLATLKKFQQEDIANGYGGTKEDGEIQANALRLQESLLRLKAWRL